MNTIIGLTGPAGSGKDTVGLLVKKLTGYSPRVRELSGVKLYSFAYPVYRLATLILNSTIEDFQNRSTKEIDMWMPVTQKSLEKAASFWNKIGLNDYEDFSYIWPIFEEHILFKNATEITTVNVNPNSNEEVLYWVLISPRKILQLVGTELGRDMLDQDVWPNTLAKRMKKDLPEIAIITDVRFNNEGDFVENRLPELFDNRMLVHISSAKEYKVSDHPSEQGVTPRDISYKLFNTFEGYKQLEQEVRILLTHLGLL